MYRYVVDYYKTSNLALMWVEHVFLVPHLDEWDIHAEVKS